MDKKVAVVLFHLSGGHAYFPSYAEQCKDNSLNKNQNLFTC